MLSCSKDSKERNTSTKRQNNDSAELEVGTAAQPLWTPHLLKPQAKKRVAVLTGAIHPDYQAEIGLTLHNRCEE